MTQIRINELRKVIRFLDNQIAEKTKEIKILTDDMDKFNSDVDKCISNLESIGKKIENVKKEINDVQCEDNSCIPQIIDANTIIENTISSSIVDIDEARSTQIKNVNECLKSWNEELERLNNERAQKVTELNSVQSTQFIN